MNSSDLAALAAARSGLTAPTDPNDVNAILLEAAVRQQVEARRLANEKLLLLARAGLPGAPSSSLSALPVVGGTPSSLSAARSNAAALAASADAVSLSVTIRQKKLKEINDQMQLLQSLKAAPAAVATPVVPPTTPGTPSFSASLPPSLPSSSAAAAGGGVVRPPDYRQQIQSIDDQMKQMQEMFNKSRAPPPSAPSPSQPPQSSAAAGAAESQQQCVHSQEEDDDRKESADKNGEYPLPDASEQTEVTLDTASNDAEGKAAALASATTSLRSSHNNNDHHHHHHHHPDGTAAPQSPRSSGKGLRSLFRGRGRRRSGTGSMTGGSGGGGLGGISSFFGQKKVYLQQIDTEIASMKEMLRELEISRDTIAGDGAASVDSVNLDKMQSDVSQSNSKQRMRSSSPSWRTGLSSKFPRKKSPAPPRKKVRHHSPER